MDCPGKLYSPGTDTGLNNFEVHLRNAKHRKKVEVRVREERRGREREREREREKGVVGRG